MECMHSPAGRDRQGRWRAGPWDIASRAHILLHSSDFGLSGFRNYVQKGVTDKSTQLITVTYHSILDRCSRHVYNRNNISKGDIMPKTRLNISLDQDLVNFIKIYIKENRTTVADVITQFFLALKRQTQGDSMEIILSNPDFHKAIIDTQSRLRGGTAKWHTFEEVFGD